MQHRWGALSCVRRARRPVAALLAVSLATIGAIAVVPASVSSASPLPGTNVRISLPADGGAGRTDSFGPSMSHNGRFVAYLAPWATNPNVDAVYLKDRDSASGPQEAVAPTPLSCVNGEFTTSVAVTFENVRMSDDATKFAISVHATGAADAGCGVADDYVELVTTGSAPIVGPFFSACPLKAGLPANTFTSTAFLDAMSADGTQVLVHTFADANAAPGCPRKLFTWAPATNATFDVINGQTNPVATLAPIGDGAISADGAHVAFVGEVPGSAEVPSLYTYDRDVDRNGVFDENNVKPNDHVIFQAIPMDLGNVSDTEVGLSRDGRVVAFSIGRIGTAAVVVDQLEVLDRDPATSPHKFPNETEKQRVYTQMTNGDGFSFSPALSSDGRYVAFVSEANNLLAGVTLDKNGSCNDGEPPSCRVYIADRIGIGGKAQIELASDGEVKGGNFAVPNPNGDSMAFGGGGIPGLSDDGRVTAYDSFADNLVAPLPVECDKPRPACDAASPDDDSDVFVHVTQPGLVGSPNPLDLGNAPLGSSAPPRVATFAHTGFGAVRPKSVDIVGPDKDEFSIQPGETCVGMVIHAADKCFISVAYKALRHGPANATLEVHHDGVPGLTTIRLVGGGVTAEGVFTLTPPVLDFGTQILTVQPAAQSVTAKNSGPSTLVFDPATINGAAVGDYHVVSDTCTKLAPGATCSISVAFKPRNVGDRHAALIVTAHVVGEASFTEMVDLRGKTPFPLVLLNPGVAHPRSVVQAIGENWPPGSTVAFVWSGLPGVQSKSFAVPATAIVPNTQQFAPNSTILVYPRAEVGTRTLQAVAPDPDVDMSPVVVPGLAIAFPVNFLVQAPTVNGELDFVVRNG